MKLNTVEKIEVVVLMDNVSDPFTVSHAGMKLNEIEYRETVLNDRSCSGAQFCRACLGLSLFIRVTTKDDVFSLLFDTGPDDNLAVENAQRLAIDLREVQAIVLSHGHFDHISGVTTCLKAIDKPELPVYAHDLVFRPRAWQLENGELVKSAVVSKADVAKAGGKIAFNRRPMTIFRDHVLLSGEVSRKTYYEAGFPGEKIMEDDQWVDAPEIIDEQTLILNLRGKGLCVFTGCGHTGVVNALAHARELTGERVHLVMGGFHLAGPSFEKRISASIDDLEKISPDYLITGHCTGFKAQAALTSRFGDRHIPYGVGTNFIFKS